MVQRGSPSDFPILRYQGGGQVTPPPIPTIDGSEVALRRVKSSVEMMSVVSIKEIFVNNDITSKEDMNKFESYSITSLANENESTTV